MRLSLRPNLRTALRLGVILPALAVPALAGAQNYSDLPPLAPLDEEEVRALPPEYRSAPTSVVTEETVTDLNGVETITRTRRIEAPRRALPAAPSAPTYAPQYAPVTYAAAPAVFERDQWIAECERRIKGQDKDDTGLIIGGLLGAIAGGVAGYEIAGVGDRVLGTVLGVGGGGLIGGLLGSLFDDDDEDQYDCEAALDSYLSQYGAPGQRIASREIAYPAYAPPAYGYGYPAGYSYGYSYAPPPQVVLVPVRTEVQQQVVVRETERFETYTVPGAVREIPTPAPSGKLLPIKGGR
ncbi:MAG: hypothetical protein C0471_01480 [Erythrobacter sp.]|nr:hypothetical protein [Erythrobacter sp.]